MQAQQGRQVRIQRQTFALPTNPARPLKVVSADYSQYNSTSTVKVMKQSSVISQQRQSNGPLSTKATQSVVKPLIGLPQRSISSNQPSTSKQLLKQPLKQQEQKASVVDFKAEQKDVNFNVLGIEDEV